MTDTPLPKTIRAFIAGSSGTGKSTLAERLYLKDARRVLIIDHTGEWSSGENFPKPDDTVDGAKETSEAIINLSRHSPNGWRLTTSIDQEELVSLINWLMPSGKLQNSPVRKVGGIVLLNDEADVLAGPGRYTKEVRSMYRRSRHVGLSIVSNTQRPSNVSREVSSQSTHAIALRLDEPRDVGYMAALMRWTPQEEAYYHQWVKRHPHGGMWKDLVTSKVLWLPDQGPPQVAMAAQRDAFDVSASRA